MSKPLHDIPKDLAAAVSIGLHGERHAFDVGVVNGEHFAVMASAGLDALMIQGCRRIAEGSLRTGGLHLDGCATSALPTRRTRIRRQRKEVVRGQDDRIKIDPGAVTVCIPAPST